MIFTVELFAGPGRREPNKWDIQRNIEAIQRAIDNKKQPAIDDMLLLDTKHILVKLQEQLP